MAIELKTAASQPYSEQYYLARQGAMFRAELKHLLALSGVRSGARVLEVGCGSGSFLRSCIASTKAATVAGIDVSPTGVSIARQRAHGATLALADAAWLPFTDGCFDIVIAQHVIEHFERPDGVLGEWRRVLVPGGVVVVATPNAFYPDPAIFDDPTHYRIYTLGSLRALFEDNGFSIERCYSLMPFLGNRRLTAKLAGLAAQPWLGLRLWPHFRTHGLTLFLRARKGRAKAATEVPRR